MHMERGATVVEPEAPRGAVAGRLPRVFVVAFSAIAGDARVRRQVEYLSERFDLVVAGYGSAIETPRPVRWIELPARRTAAARGAAAAALAAGRLVPPLADRWFATQPGFALALAAARAERCDVYLANDWTTLPVAGAGAEAHGGQLVFDAHEYAPLEWEGRAAWRLLHAPLVRRTLRRYAPRCAGSVTVSPPIAERYEREYGLRAVLVRTRRGASRTCPITPRPASRSASFITARRFASGASSG
jgi:hypothetical protein